LGNAARSSRGGKFSGRLRPRRKAVVDTSSTTVIRNRSRECLVRVTAPLPFPSDLATEFHRETRKAFQETEGISPIPRSCGRNLPPYPETNIAQAGPSPLCAVHSPPQRLALRRARGLHDARSGAPRSTRR